MYVWQNVHEKRARVTRVRKKESECFFFSKNKCNKTESKRENRNRGHLSHFSCAHGVISDSRSLDISESGKIEKQIRLSSVKVSAKRIFIAFGNPIRLFFLENED